MYLDNKVNFSCYRITPVAAVNVRWFVEDVVIAGYKIPPKVSVSVLTYEIKLFKKILETNTLSNSSSMCSIVEA